MFFDSKTDDERLVKLYKTYLWELFL